jgi:hypothetical protein
MVSARYAAYGRSLLLGLAQSSEGNTLDDLKDAHPSIPITRLDFEIGRISRNIRSVAFSITSHGFLSQLLTEWAFSDVFRPIRLRHPVPCNNHAFMSGVLAAFCSKMGGVDE